MARRERPFKGRQFTAAVILWAVRWYVRFPISYRELELMLRDRRLWRFAKLRQVKYLRMKWTSSQRREACFLGVFLSSFRASR
ncbi:hypothetical protein M2351_006513 [Azospirillum canadense]|nr:hypothetical protein [Azospirillum canadense]